MIYTILRLNELCMNKLLSMDSYLDYVCIKIIHRYWTTLAMKHLYNSTN